MKSNILLIFVNDVINYKNRNTIIVLLFRSIRGAAGVIAAGDNYLDLFIYNILAYVIISINLVSLTMDMMTQKRLLKNNGSGEM